MHEFVSIPPPESPLHGPRPSLPPAQNILSDVIRRKTSLDRKQTPSLTIGIDTTFGLSVDARLAELVFPVEYKNGAIYNDSGFCF